MKILEARYIFCLSPNKESFQQPHVRVELFGGYEKDRRVWRTNDNHCDNHYESLNGFHPVWNKFLEPHLVANIDLAFIEFSVTEVSTNIIYNVCHEVDRDYFRQTSLGKRCH